MDSAETIVGLPLFSGLSRHELARIAGFLQEEAFSAGEVIFKQGDSGDALYVVAMGVVEILSDSGDLGTDTFALLGPRDCFGEMGLFTGSPRSATARAAVDTVLFKLDKQSWDKLLRQYPSITLYFCQVLCQRLSDTDIHLMRERDALYAAFIDFVEGQTSDTKEVLFKAASLRQQDCHTIERLFAVENACTIFAQLSLTVPSLIRSGHNGDYTYAPPFKAFLYERLKGWLTPGDLQAIHEKCASYFKEQGAWYDVLDQYVHAENWEGAQNVLHAHTDEIVASASTDELLAWLDQACKRFPAADTYLKRLRAETLIHIGEFDSAIQCYEELLRETAGGAKDRPGFYYEKLARAHQEAGNHEDALSYLDHGLEAMNQSGLRQEVLEPMRSVSLLQQGHGNFAQAVRWRRRAFDIIQQLGQRRLLARNKALIGIALSVIVGPLVWHLPPTATLTPNAIYFLATMSVAIVLWVFESFDEYVVAIVLLLSWLLLAVAPPAVVLSGFSSSSWFFVLGVFGIAAAVARTGLLYRVTLRIIKLIPPNYKRYVGIMATSGLFATAILPTARARISIIMPLCQEISESFGFTARSNGSAGLALSAFVGFALMTFMFLTGATYTLLGWNLLSPRAQSEFTWGIWLLAALPAGLVTLTILVGGILLLFPVKEDSLRRASATTLDTQLNVLGPLTRQEWMSLAIIGLVVSGFLFGSRIGIKEPWVALGGLVAFAFVGSLDKNTLKRGIDWPCLIFFGVVAGMSAVITHLGIERWLEASLGSLLSSWFIDPFVFLLLVVLVMSATRFLLSPLSAVLLLMIVFMPFAEDQGVHPGVLLVTLALASNAWFFPYQLPSYQIAYYGTDQKAFSHGQARKLMVVQLLATATAVAASVPYWRFLGFIR